MTRKNYSLIPVLAAIVLIPQALFWWLAPAAAPARLAVYIGGTLLTVGIPVAYLVTYWNSNLRKAAGLSVVCCILETAVIAISVLLLGIDVSVRSAVFAFIITSLVCLIALIPLINAALKQQRQGIYSASLTSTLYTFCFSDSPHSNNPNAFSALRTILEYSSLTSSGDLIATLPPNPNIQL